MKLNKLVFKFSEDTDSAILSMVVYSLDKIMPFCNGTLREEKQVVFPNHVDKNLYFLLLLLLEE